MDFLVAAANLHAENYKLKGTRDRNTIANILQQVKVPEFKPKSGVRIAVTDAEMQSESQSSGLG